MAPNPTLILAAPIRFSSRPPLRDLRPIDQYAALFVGFDFGPGLAPGVTISNALLACSVYMGADAGAALRILGASAITTSLKTGQPNQMVVQLIGQMSPLAQYKLQCFVTTSDGETPDIWGIIGCTAIPVAPVSLAPLVDAEGNALVDAEGNPLLG